MGRQSGCVCAPNWTTLDRQQCHGGHAFIGNRATTYACTSNRIPSSKGPIHTISLTSALSNNPGNPAFLMRL
jgi:hypothetical protein